MNLLRSSIGPDCFAGMTHTPEAQERRQAIYRTANELALTPECAVLVGGAALALHGYDTYVPMRFGEAFDVDAHISQVALTQFKGPNGARQLDPYEDRVVRIAPRQYDQLPFMGVHTSDNYFDNQHALISAGDIVVVGGIATRAVPHLLRTKLEAGRPKDAAGILQAYIIKRELGVPLHEDPDWVRAVTEATRQIRTGDVIRNTSVVKRIFTRLPRWLRTLKSCDFEHSYFDDLKTAGNPGRLNTGS